MIWQLLLDFILYYKSYDASLVFDSKFTFGIAAPRRKPDATQKCFDFSIRHKALPWMPSWTKQYNSLSYDLQNGGNGSLNKLSTFYVEPKNKFLRNSCLF